MSTGTTPLEPGDTVRWWTKDGGWRFGRIATAGRSEARIDMGGSIRKVPLSELRPWPPTHDEKNTTPHKRVRRGRSA